MNQCIYKKNIRRIKDVVSFSYSLSMCLPNAYVFACKKLQHGCMQKQIIFSNKKIENFISLGLDLKWSTQKINTNFLFYLWFIKIKKSEGKEKNTHKLRIKNRK